MSRTNRFLSGIGLGYASQILTTLVAFWLTPFLLHRIGQHDYGLWLVGTQLMFYLSLLDIGIIALLPRETAFATGRASSVEEASDLPVIVGQTMRLILWQMPFVALAAIIAWFIIPSAWEGLRNPIGVALLAFVLTFPLRIFAAVLQGLQDLAFLGRTYIISFLVSTALTVALVLAGWGLYSLAVGWTALQLIGAAAGYYRLRSHFPTVMPAVLPPLDSAVARTRLKQGFWIGLNQVARILLNGTEILIIGKYFGPAAVVPYVCTGKMISVLANQPQLLVAAAGPALSEMRVSESRARLPQVCVALSQAMLMLSGAVVLLVLVINQGFVERWVGGNQFGGLWLTGLILVSMLLRHWNLTIGTALFCFGYERRICLTALLDGLVSVSAVLFLVWQYGVIGAPIGLIIGVCLVSLPLNLAALARESNVSIWDQIRPLAPWFIRFAILGIAGAALARIWTPNTVPLLLATAAACSLIYLLIMFPLALREPLGIYVRPRVMPLMTKLFRLRPRPSNAA